jgi:hypothetical protein
MRLVITSFLILLTGYAYAHTSSHKGNICNPPARNIGKLQAKALHITGLYLASNDESQENPLLISVDYEDDDTFLRKHTLPLAGYLLAFSESFISYDCNTCLSRLSSREHQCSPVSCKYILQRVLRI